MIQNAFKMLTRNKHYYNSHKKDLIIEIQGELLYGIHPIRMAIQAKKRTVHKIYYNKGSDKAVLIANHAKSNNIPTQTISRFNLDELTRKAFKYKDHHVHQGIVADVSRIYPVPVDYKMPQLPDLKFDFDKDFGREDFLLLLYDIKDPMNLGALLRTAYFFGVNNIIMAGDRIDLAAIVSKTSSGSLEMMQVFAVRNTVALLESLKAHGWQVLALSTPSPQLKLTQQLHKVSNSKKTLLIVGSEGSGIPDDVLNCADSGVYIPSQVHKNNMLFNSNPKENPQNSKQTSDEGSINGVINSDEGRDVSEDNDEFIDDAYPK